MKQKKSARCDRLIAAAVAKRDGKILLIKNCFGFGLPYDHHDLSSSSETIRRALLRFGLGIDGNPQPLLYIDDADYTCERGEELHSFYVATGTLVGGLRPVETVKAWVLNIDNPRNRHLKTLESTDWVSPEVIKELHWRTEKYLDGKILEDEWQRTPRLIPAFSKIFKMIGLV